MVQLTSITTRGGDKGKTSLADGRRVSKHSLRIEAIGAVDELNSIIGVTHALLVQSKIDENKANVAVNLNMIQNDLFDVGADLCLPDQERSALRINNIQVERLDNLVIQYNSQLSSLTSFVLPGGTLEAAHMHVCRTTARKTERAIVALDQDETLNPDLLQYINRLSDVFFVMARTLNNLGENDVLWEPGKYQQTKNSV
ncbi:MAG: ATP:cob(I)alamin adenosyltransferase [Candidatus Puniceispirillum sp.]|nr:ATP:cob(I)alamin adenosyltransferase [Candidatus Pelagibacter sp.]MBA4282776.1 ATP:cob(I)alamin adenosyltransferase [Candidatus Puniceispirillum sp.]